MKPGENSFRVLWNDGECVFGRGWQPGADGQATPVLAAWPASDPPTTACFDRLSHEYGLKEELEPAWAVKPRELVRESGRIMLLFDDTGGEPLDRFVGEAMDAGRFLRLAVAIASALGKLHQHGLVHKDIKPANILVMGEGAEARFTGFGIASRLPRERQSPEPPEVIAGTLAYMAPEQTGRMNRSIDARSDLYALGVTFYQMLTGVLPFTAVDPMEWVHWHMARCPTPPTERVKEVPGTISAIVMKLLAKTAEERYQTATGVERDLRSCLEQWQTGKRIGEFKLGEHDIPDRLLIPEKLYGREREIKTLLDAFERVITGGVPELVLVSGYSGIGKSAVVHELHKELVPTRGLFASGKFDQYKRDIPYATLAQAFQGIIRRLLASSEADLVSWRDALSDALGSNGQLMVDLIPELKHIIGDQPPVPELPSQEAQRRFQLVFRRFMNVFARPEHPLALFLDDLQWLDAATFNLLEDLLIPSDLQNLIVIGAYRDNEVTADHPLRRKLDAIRAAGCKVAEISLTPLTREHLQQLIADALHSDPERAAPLARLVHDKTGGNPFFAIQFISSLAEEGMLIFDHDGGCWSWDLGRIHAKGYTDNVVDLMVGKLTRLPRETREALQQFACLGNIANAQMLSLVLGIPQKRLLGALEPAVAHGLLERLPDAYRFVHDRVQEAAYSLIPEERRAELHLRIGRLLAANTAPERIYEYVFDIVSQLNRGAALITSEERERLAQFNLLAGKRAKASTAYSSALNYFVAGATLLPADAWERQHQLVFALELNRAECEFLLGALPDAETRLAQLSTCAVRSDDQATVACLRIDLYAALGQTDRSAAVGLDYLREHLGIDWSPHPANEEVRCEYGRIWSQLGSRTIEELIDLPLMSDLASPAALDVLTRLVGAVWHTDANLACMAICLAVNLSLERGNSDGSCYHYVALGYIAGPRFGDYAAGFRFGQLGCQLVEDRELTRFQARTYKDFGAHVIPWTRHVRTGREILLRALEIANQNGDLTFAGYSYVSLNSNLLAAGDPLVEVQRQAEIGLAFARKVRFQFVIDLASAQLGLVRSLRGLTRKFGSFDDDDGFDEAEIERRFSGDPNLILAETCYCVRKLQARFFAGDYEGAVDASLRAQQLPWTSVSHFEETPEHHFYGALARAACCDTATAEERARHIEALTVHYRQLQIYAKNCPENFDNRAALVGAEIARVEGREIDAMRLYDQAIRSANANGFVHHEALAYELAARFYAERGFDNFTHLYFRNARSCYMRWGADGKVRQLDQFYPRLGEEDLGPSPKNTIGAPVEQLDLATVIKISQAVSGEIVTGKLIDTLMRTALEHAGAERGVLLVPNKEQLRVEAVAETTARDVAVHLPPVAGMIRVPTAMVNFVARTGEAVIVDDACIQNTWSDEYMRDIKPRSMLCMPLVKQGRLIALLYLENNLAPRVFTPARIAVLKLLTSQAATALENTRLYEDLAGREARIRRLVDANIIGIFIFALDGRILDANDAFLRLIGYDREDLVTGRIRWVDLTPEEWFDRDMKQWVPELKKTGILAPIEKEYLRKDGSRVPVLIGGARFEGSEDEGVTFVLDLTERKRAEETIRRSEEKLRQVIEAIPAMVWTALPDGNIDFINRHWQEFTGLTLNETLAWSWTNAPFHPDDIEPYLAKWNISLATGEAFEAEMRVRRAADGEYRWLHESAVPLRDETGNILKWYGTVVDIEDRKQAEEALQRAQGELAHVSRVTTMGVLTSSIAHEVNQPLGAIVINANAALRWLNGQPPNLDEVRETLTRIVRDGHHASEVIAGMRALLKKRATVRERVDLAELIQQVLALVQGELRRHSIALRIELAEDVAPVVGDHVQLQQVILNLVMNGIDAMKDVDWRRELLVTSWPETSGMVSVAVKDVGPGLGPQAMEQIFEPFYTTKAEGLGMGLAICRSIIEAHGGRLWASVNEPRGAVFQFTLPAGRDELTPAKQTDKMPVL
ncbi:AAA family ATPase [Rhizobium calliandrae]|uniref:histidine kinase n=1 Tax=Rhizobium calliandrae TaxID=1312182 RepID=A0ABT7KQI9_9HYPH|nr:AAA family ATPase [Rhizobium calliandrae]MDL2410372.1 AAA family ATPase [Rhizobium calliandrae]